MKTIRLDIFLIEQGHSQSIEKAKKEIISGWVKVNGETLRDPSKKIIGNEKIIIERPGGSFVSRGGDKLQHALREFNIDLNGLITLDLGASTGGFTDCMLKSGAVKVYAVDVGYNQLDYSLRIDPRVVVMEKTHARDIKREMFPDRIDFFTADLSFISILKVLPAVCETFDAIRGVVLVKPQFEAESSQHEKGVVRNPKDHVEILRKVAAGIVETGFNILNITHSPIKGPAGNIEFLFFIFKDDLSADKNNEKNDLRSEIYAIVETAHNTLQ
jgi:23S rRNA (cytidine1920-2'-O)/16S rRNA (cytidine1409-2'-O)-methyltransferase